MTIFYFAIGLINLLAFIVIGTDKKRSINNDERVSEVNLFLWAIFFGSAGVLLGMLAFRHKTQKLKFIFGVTVLLLQQLITIYQLLAK